MLHRTLSAINDIAVPAQVACRTGWMCSAAGGAAAILEAGRRTACVVSVFILRSES